MMDVCKIWIVTSAFNEEHCLVPVVQEMKSCGYRVLVIDDGSSDQTHQRAQDSGADVVIRNEKNMGKGASLQRGFQYLLDHDRSFEAVVIMDSDGQHLPGELHKFSSALSQADVVIGNRLLHPKGMPIVRLFTNRFMSLLISGICRKHIADSQCGYKALKRKVLEAIRFTSTRYEIDSEIILRASKAGFTLCSVPIESVYQNHKSSIQPFFDTVRFIRFLWKHK